MARKPKLTEYFNEVLLAKVFTTAAFFAIAMAAFVSVFDPPEELVVLLLMGYGAYLYGLVRDKAVVGDYGLPASEEHEHNQTPEEAPVENDNSSVVRPKARPSSQTLGL